MANIKSKDQRRDAKVFVALTSREKQNLKSLSVRLARAEGWLLRELWLAYSEGRVPEWTGHPALKKPPRKPATLRRA